MAESKTEQRSQGGGESESGTRAQRRPLRVLSIDGGGVRGVVPLKVLDFLKGHTGGKEPHELFDVMVGTSTGGILAILLGVLQVPLAECTELYKSLSEEIFETSLFRGLTGAATTGAWHSTPRLEAVLKREISKRARHDQCKGASECVFQDVGLDCFTWIPKMSDFPPNASRPYVMVVSTVTGQDGPFFCTNFKDPALIGRVPDEVAVWEAARATSAAPTYFDAMRLRVMGTNFDFIDGGVGYNNPMSVIPTRLCEGPFNLQGNDKRIIVSLGTGVQSFDNPDTSSFTKLAGYLVKVATECESTHSQVKKICAKSAVPYYRFNPSQGVGDFAMDKAKAEYIDKMQQATTNYLANQADVLMDVAQKLELANTEAEELEPPVSQTVDDGLVNPFFLKRITDKLFGRDKLVEKVKEALKVRRSVLLVGGPGEGKSSLAMEAAVQLQMERMFLGGTFEVDLNGLEFDSGSDDVKGCVQEFIGKQLMERLCISRGGIATRPSQGEKCWPEIELWLRKLGDRRVLIAFENVEAVGDTGIQVFNKIVDGMRRNFETIAVMGTSRRRTAWTGGALIEVARLDPDASVKLLQRAVGDESKVTITQCERLADRCRHNAQLLEVVGGILAEGLRTATEMLDGEHMLECAARDDGDRLHGLANTVRTWLVNFLPEESVHVLERLAVFEFGDFCTEAAVDAIGASGKEVTRQLDQLARLCIIRPIATQYDIPGGKRYTMHAILHLVAVELFDRLPQDDQAQAREQFARYVLRLATLLNPAATPVVAREAATELLSVEAFNIRRLSTNLLDEHVGWFRTAECAASVVALARQMQDRWVLADAEPLYRRALAIQGDVLEPMHTDVATTCNGLAQLLQKQGKYDEAEHLFLRSLEINKKLHGPDHPEVATALNNLAGLLRAQGKYDEAEPLYRKANTILEKALGAEHPNVASGLNNLAELLRTQGKYDEAEPLYRRAIDIGERTVGPDHPNLATRLNNLAKLLRAQGNYDEAEPLYMRSLAIREKALGPEHPAVATALNNLAGLLESQGKVDEAKPMLQRAVDIGTKSLGPEHPNVEIYRKRLASLRAR